MIWPFPFPYSQLNFVLLNIYMVFTPLVICTWPASPVLVALFTCMSVACMLGIDFIAAELENPFGDDANDLPCFEMQHEFNRNLLALLNPNGWRVPIMLPTAKTNYIDLVSESHEDMLSLQQYHEAQQTTRVMITQLIAKDRRSTMRKASVQAHWASPTRQSGVGVRRTLRMSTAPEGAMPNRRLFASTAPNSFQDTAANDTSTPQQDEEPTPPFTATKSCGTDGGGSKDAAYPCDTGDGVDARKSRSETRDNVGHKRDQQPPWSNLLHDLSQQMRQDLEHLLIRLGSLQDRQIGVLEELLLSARSPSPGARTFAPVARYRTVNGIDANPGARADSAAWAPVGPAESVCASAVAAMTGDSLGGLGRPHGIHIEDNAGHGRPLACQDAPVTRRTTVG
eukprot:gnl/TRDRNA2_/TRDRNA2_153893_c1_seq1.p1 gnl/TRDRNA2_/TRDRNA2_153893_c1~~gnl/TRDRNA2_/TRDRNA2_153893_c1_seq1.p1  ORF type:complete len:396 (+),score=36.67 gnl/TRDRNA2_/TRDRNA2_153893_c1_seq1:3-1190(+)